ncbi:MAG TPA: hypothetical protein VHY20_04190, partial [Pirellulales bacterium]|nr:hypothetical protein [Pirellulales bacterium]
MQVLSQIANPGTAEPPDLAAAAERGGASELSQRLAQQRAQAAQFRRHYDEQLAAHEQSWARRLEELDEQVRRRAEADYQFAADELARQRRRLKKKEARLEAATDRVELRRTRTRYQRRRLAAYFRLQKRRLRKPAAEP